MRQLSLDDVFYGFDGVSIERKEAIAFAMYAGISLNQVKKLKWSDDIGDINWRAKFILSRVKLSNNLNNVFWELSDRRHVEMDSLNYIFGLSTMWVSWELFVLRNSDSIPIFFK
jgi:hypothetical protein